MSELLSLPVARATTDLAGTITLTCASKEITYIQVVAASSDQLYGSRVGNTASIGAARPMHATLQQLLQAIRHANVEVDDSGRVTLFDFSC